MAVNSLGYQVNKHPIAQSFYVDEMSGYFATKIGLYFKSTFSPTTNLQLPINIHLRPMRNGMPSDNEIVPGSVVYVDYSDVNTSADASAVTYFTFDEPIYLRGLTDYAIVVYAETPEYEIYISELDGTVLGSQSDRVHINPNLGSLFYSQNGATFSPDQRQDLKFEIFRANFVSSGFAYLNNSSVPRKSLNDNPIKTFGGDSDVRVFDINHGLQVNDKVLITGATTVGGLNVNGSQTVTKIDHSGFEFKATTPADSDEVGGGDDVQATQNIPYSVIYPNAAMLRPVGTDVFAAFKGTSGKSMAGTETPYTVDGDFQKIRLNRNNYADHNYVVAADSIADLEIGAGARTAQMRFEFTTSNPLVSPMIDLQRSSLTLIDNVVDNQDSAIAGSTFNVPLQYVSETSPTGGSSASKHITKAVKLAQSAVGLKVIVAAHVPNTADFDVYFRTGTGADLLSDIAYTKALKPTLPKDENPNTYRDYEILIGGQNGTMPAFTEFQLKIVFRSRNSAKVAVIKDLRAIALSV